MKGEMNMKRFKLMIITLNRFRLLLLTAFVVAATALSAVTYAAQEPQAAGQNPVTVKKETDQAAKARAQRAAVLKQRKDAQKFIRENATGHQPGTDVPASDNAGPGGAK
jgi:C4-dicarboxylate-specific signal transduction histidine kinase